MTFREWVYELLDRWRWIAGGLLAGLLLGALAAAVAPERYAASTTLYVSPGIPTTDTDAAYQGSLLSEHRMKSYVELLTSQRISEDVAEELGLAESAAELAQRIEAVAQPETLVLTVTATDGSPDAAADLANATAASFADLVERLEQTPGSDAGSPVRVQVVQPAQPPADRVAPNLAVNLVLGAVLGCLAGFGAAALRKALDDSIRSTRVLHERTGVAVLGVIPVQGHPRRSLPWDDPPQEEAFRRLRTNLHHTWGMPEHGLLLVTSPGSGVGRSTLVCNLAASMGAGGSRVLAVDADLRRPGLTHRLDAEPQVGLIDVLAGRSTIGEAIRPSPRGTFDILASGPVPLNPSEVIGSQQMADLLQELKLRYDVVLLDSSPLLEVADAVELAASADGAIMVCRFGHTTYGEFSTAVRALSAVPTRLLGAVLTMAPDRALHPMPTRSRAHQGIERAGEAQPVLGDALRRVRPRGPADEQASSSRHADPAGVSALSLPAPGGAAPFTAAAGSNHHGPTAQG